MHSMDFVFLGAGNSHSKDLGNSAAVLEEAGEPSLCIDYGFTTHHAYHERYKSNPKAIFITHCHLDHIGGLEMLFYSHAFNTEKPIKIFVPIAIVGTLHNRVADYPGQVAEGGVNFWDVFHLIPVADSFYHNGNRYGVVANRHHNHNSSFSLFLKGKFFYSGDTKAIPEIVTTYADNGELIFHDATLEANPSHAGVFEIQDAYRKDQLGRMYLYHLSSKADIAQVEGIGLKAVAPGRPICISRAAIPNDKYEPAIC